MTSDTHVHVETEMSAMKLFHQCMLIRNSSQQEKMSQELKILPPPPLFNIKFTQHILCNYFMHSGLQCRCKSSCTHTDSMRLWSWGREAGDAVRGHTVQGEQACCWLSKAEAAKRQRDEHASRHKEELTSKVQTRQSAESLSNDSSEQQPQQCTNTEHQKCKSIA